MNKTAETTLRLNNAVIKTSWWLTDKKISEEVIMSDNDEEEDTHNDKSLPRPSWTEVFKTVDILKDFFIP